MIFVDRSREGRPGVLDPEHGKGGEETREAIAEIVAADAAGRDPNLDFKVYKDPVVKLALHRLFHGKCAYCESRYVASAPMDVEHYRPKKAVEKWQAAEARRRGYYWLGAEWENLLPSCIDCNRRRTHLDPETTRGEVLGKRAIFPVMDEARRWTSHEKENREVPLLLNPCHAEDRPEQLLAFSDDGLVLPSASADDDERRRIDASIEVYGLNRPGLVQERAAWIRLLQHRMRTLDLVVRLLDELPEGSADHEMAENLLQFLLDDLISFQDPRRPYSLMARQLTEDYLQDFRPDPPGA